MRIRYVLNNAFGTGGTIRTVINQANALSATHDVEIASVYRSREKPVFALDPRVRLVPITGLRDDGSRWTDPWKQNSRFWRKTRRFPNPFPHGRDFRYKRWDPVVDRAVIRYFRAEREGVLVTTRPGLNLLAAWAAPRQLIRIAQDHMNLDSYKPSLRAEILRAYPRFDAVAVLTEADLATWTAVGPPGVRLVRVPNGIPARERVAEAAGRARTVLAAGRLSRQKGFDLLIDAFAQIREDRPDWRLDIFGEGKLRPKLTAQIAELGVGGQVKLRGVTPHLDRELDKAAVFALSSRHEGLPMVLLEAMAAGVPPVAFDCPTGPAEVVHDGANGLLIPAEDTTALAKGLARLMDDADLRAELGRAAVTTAAGYAIPAVAAQWEELFTTLAAQRRSPDAAG